MKPTVAAPPAEPAIQIELPERASLESAARALRGATLLEGRPLRDWQRETREVFGLPTNLALVATGHQAQVYHPGILAKWFLADAVARELGGAVGQILVDEDVNDPGLIEYPALRSEGDGPRLVVATLPFQRAPNAITRGPVALRTPLTPKEMATSALLPVPDVAEGLARIREAFDATADRPNAALQLVAVNERLLHGILAPRPTITGTALLASPIGRALVEAMRREPERCIDAYNAALAADPRLAAPLVRATRELPLWILRPGEERTRYHLALHGGDASPGLLAPRAFLLTALARLALCDLFVHGTGGGRYERVTEAWIRAWLGLELAPIAVATATLRLPLEQHVGDDVTTTPADLRRALWDPAAPPGSDGPSPQKSLHLARIAELPRRSPARREAYRAMRSHLDEERTRRHERIEALSLDAARSRARAAAAEIARRRTWPFPLYGPERLRALQASIASASSLTGR